MSKKRKRNKGEIGPSRPIVDDQGRADWLRQKGDGHAGFEELLRPGSGKNFSNLDKLPGSHPLRRLLSKINKNGEAARKPRHAKKANAEAADFGAGTSQSVLPSIPPSEPAAPPLLSVPVPTANQVEQDMKLRWASRDGQAEFREAIIAAYGACGVTGCAEEAALQAAHIIPYVDRRSNIISNGLCLRADLHLLYDRNLLLISGEGLITIAPSVQEPEYRRLHGQKINFPMKQSDWPDPRLLDSRAEIVSCGVRLVS